MKRLAWPFSALLFFAVSLSGCTQNETTRSNQNGEPTVSDSTRYVTFREGCKQGDRYIAISRAEAVWGEGAATPMIIGEKTDCELAKAEGGFYTWKCVSSQDTEQMGTHHFLEGKGLEKNRVVFTTNNSYGNLVSEEGQNPDYGVTYKRFPERPVKVGDSWEGYKLERGKRYKDSYTLEGLAQVNGKEYAIISSESEENGGSSTSKSWVELSTGVTHKSEGSGSYLNLAGQKGNMRWSSAIVTAKGQPALP